MKETLSDQLVGCLKVVPFYCWVSNSECLWGEVCKSLVIVLLLTGEEEFERSRVALEESVVLLGDLCELRLELDLE